MPVVLSTMINLAEGSWLASEQSQLLRWAAITVLISSDRPHALSFRVCNMSELELTAFYGWDGGVVFDQVTWVHHSSEVALKNSAYEV